MGQGYMAFNPRYMRNEMYHRVLNDISASVVLRPLRHSLNFGQSVALTHWVSFKITRILKYYDMRKFWYVFFKLIMACSFISLFIGMTEYAILFLVLAVIARIELLDFKMK